MIWVDDKESSDHPCNSLHNVSLGGLAFRSPRAILIGQVVEVSFPLLDEQHFLSGQIVWNKKIAKGFETGLEFNNSDDFFRLRMIEQICHIEHYRAEVKRLENRLLSSEQAAREWVSRYASEFPRFER